MYTLDRESQVRVGQDLWKGPQQFSVRAALARDGSFLYLGVDANDPDLCQPFRGRGPAAGDVFVVVLETAFCRNSQSTRAGADEYRLLFSPGNFAGVEPSIFSDEDYLPPRPIPRDYSREIKAVWKKTASGFSGDIAIPVSYFEGGRFLEGCEIGLSFGAQKVLKPAPSTGAEEDLERIVLSSKTDPLFPVNLGNPSSYQRLVLAGPVKP